MLKLLIYENNSRKVISLINKISDNCKQIQISHISTTFDDLLNILNSRYFDILILDFSSSLLKKFFEFLENNSLNIYKKSILLICDNCADFRNYINSFFVFSCRKNYSFIVQDLNKIFLRLIKSIHIELDVRNKIFNELNKLHYNYSYLGTKYLEDVIFEVYISGYNFDGNLLKSIYPILARKYNKSIDSIYSNIKQATRIMILDCPESIINSYFNYHYFISPKVKEIIFTVIKKIS